MSVQGAPEEAATGGDNAKRICWICFENDLDDPAADWISPCKCRGSLKWTHRACLQQYIEVRQISKFRNASKCGLCRQMYVIIDPERTLMEKVAYGMRQCNTYFVCILANIMFYVTLFWALCIFGAFTIVQLIDGDYGIFWIHNSKLSTLYLILPMVLVVLMSIEIIIELSSRWLYNETANFYRRQDLHVLFFELGHFLHVDLPMLYWDYMPVFLVMVPFAIFEHEDHIEPIRHNRPNRLNRPHRPNRPNRMNRPHRHHQRPQPQQPHQPHHRQPVRANWQNYVETLYKKVEGVFYKALILPAILKYIGSTWFSFVSATVLRSLLGLITYIILKVLFLAFVKILHPKGDRNRNRIYELRVPN